MQIAAIPLSDIEGRCAKLVRLLRELPLDGPNADCSTVARMLLHADTLVLQVKDLNAIWLAELLLSAPCVPPPARITDGVAAELKASADITLRIEEVGGPTARLRESRGPALDGHPKARPSPAQLGRRASMKFVSDLKSLADSLEGTRSTDSTAGKSAAAIGRGSAAVQPGPKSPGLVRSGSTAMPTMLSELRSLAASFDAVSDHLSGLRKKVAESDWSGTAQRVRQWVHRLYHARIDTDGTRPVPGKMWQG